MGLIKGLNPDHAIFSTFVSWGPFDTFSYFLLKLGKILLNFLYSF